ncbi:MAG: chemotaxis-specific protein-glutamate methyltransferase CheB [Spirochaetales bacterium]|nr:chemotaxis-specific protein-glutamate methyltransferase CheB [Leptospiraceae bacterium]MCP5482744.1 chemotaxis-specific protein-glutamate methyltransferase CheB [Spirochaetales bacterium]MCP5485238.1 chemotaxis-specific protein-glutamate methyltransferase CheB [Spirochaetales bacterium]
MPFEVLVVDDSPLVRAFVRDVIEQESDVHVCAEARDGREALAALERQSADLIILDVEMPGMDGLETLGQLKKRGNTVPVVMLSGLTGQGAITTLRALDLGAVDFITKPGPTGELKNIASALRNVIKDLRLREDQSVAHDVPLSRDHRVRSPGTIAKCELLVIGASAGGPVAIRTILEQLPSTFPAPIVIVQHMPPVYTAAFARRLDEVCALNVREGHEGQRLEAGTAVLAPGGFHTHLQRSGPDIVLALEAAPARNFASPAIDPTFSDAARVVGPGVVGLLLTGMGSDGVQGLRAIREANGHTLAQDRGSSVVFGMNRRAIEQGLVDRTVSLKNVVEVLSAYFPYP